MNWRKENVENERSINRFVGILTGVLALVMIGRALLMWISDTVYIGISQLYLQPVVHTPAYDLFIGLVLLLGAWSFIRHYGKKK